MFFKDAVQSGLGMCTKEPSSYDTNSLTMFCVLAKSHCPTLIKYFIVMAGKYIKVVNNLFIKYTI